MRLRSQTRRQGCGYFLEQHEYGFLSLMYSWMTSWWYYWGHVDVGQGHVICWMSNTADCVYYFSKLWGESRQSSDKRVEKETLGFSIFLDGLQGVWKCGENYTVFHVFSVETEGKVIQVKNKIVKLCWHDLIRYLNPITILLCFFFKLDKFFMSLRITVHVYLVC